MSNSVLPGDKIAIIEEYEAGSNACDDGHVVRATVIGESEVDKKNRLVNVKNNKPISIPEKDDIVIGISGSGNSENVIKAIQFANEKNAQTICLVGGDGGKLANISQLCLIIPNNNMLTIETMHLLVCHLLTTLLRSDGKPLFSY